MRRFKMTDTIVKPVPKRNARQRRDDRQEAAFIEMCKRFKPIVVTRNADGSITL